MHPIARASTSRNWKSGGRRRARAGITTSRHALRRASTASQSGLATCSADLIDLNPGHYVVHSQHGVAQYLGLREIVQADSKGDYMLLEYAAGAKLYVPLTRMDLVQRFRGGGESKPV